MSEETEQPKRRGRPPLNTEERKRHTMTFRMRTDLRAAVEELAQSNGRSLSEQIEHYVETGVSTDISYLYKYSHGGIPESLKKCSIGAPKSNIKVKLVSEHSNIKISPHHDHNIVSDKFKDTVTNKNAEYSRLAWSEDPTQRQSAIEMARLMFDAARKGSIEALSIALGVDIVDEMLAENDIGRRKDLDLLSAIALSRVEMRLMEELEQLRIENDQLKGSTNSPQE